jgi:uncharacterized membrane protein YgaE (UPF0421/DUF939 family)
VTIIMPAQQTPVMTILDVYTPQLIVLMITIVPMMVVMLNLDVHIIPSSAIQDLLVSPQLVIPQLDVKMNRFTVMLLY